MSGQMVAPFRFPSFKPVYRMVAGHLTYADKALIGWRSSEMTLDHAIGWVARIPEHEGRYRPSAGLEGGAAYAIVKEESSTEAAQAERAIGEMLARCIGSVWFWPYFRS